MDAYEATRVVFSRIQALDPENAAKIMGILLIQDHGEKEMIRLAFGPETLLHSVILKARRDLGLLLPSSSSSAAAAAAAATTPPSPLPSPSPSPFLLARQTSFRNSTANSSSGCLSPSSWAPQALPFSRSSSSEQQEMVVEGEQQMMLNNDYLLQEQLSFLNEQQQQQIGGAEGGVYWGDQHQRVCLSPDGSGWKPCLYFARGFCKNGSSCRFLHGPAEDISAAAVEQQCQELMLMRSKSQRLMSSAAVAAATATAAAAAFPYSPTGSSAANKGFNLMMQQSESQRSAAVAAAAMMLESENKFMGRVRMERSDFAGMVNPGSRQIYLTFPADSTFREEDVSNYFSIYGPVQDVRIPYQQKRMFGFVTFVYPETVRLILAKGNPHFVCDARVLVKPYKEKGKVPDKKLHQGERVDFTGCGTPTGLDDSRDPYDLQPLASSRLLYGSNGQEALLRRKMEEQQAAAELQQAIEMQGRRFMGLQLLDLKNISISSPSSNGPLLSPLATIPSSTTFINKHHNNTGPVSDGNGDGNGSERSSSGTSQDETTGEDKSLSPASGNASAISNADNKQQKQLQQPAVKSDQRAIATVEPNANEDIHFQESAGAEIHNLPDSPFASPTKSSFLPDRFALAIDDEDNGNGNGNGHLIASSLLSPSSPLENVASFKSCYFQMPRYSSGHGAVGL